MKKNDRAIKPAAIAIAIAIAFSDRAIKRTKVLGRVLGKDSQKGS